MASPRKFLIVDDDSRGLLYVSKTLLRHYPDSVVQECQDLHTAIELVRDLPAAQNRTVIIAHRTLQIGGRDLVAALRAVHSSAPIVWMGDPTEARLAQSAGATRFLDKDAWLVIGTLVADLV
jgi:DNA-binding NarL/FixJ family response regulator